MKSDRIISEAKSFFQKLKADKKAMIVIIVGALIMFAVLFVDFPKTTEKSKESIGCEDYENLLEEKLRGLISNIDGAGKVKVMLTFESSKEAVYAYDSDESIESRSEDSNSKKTKNEYIIVKKDGDEGGLQVKDIYPKVRGAAVVCEGADNPIIKGQIVSVVSALFDIKSTNISVAVMAD